MVGVGGEGGVRKRGTEDEGWKGAMEVEDRRGAWMEVGNGIRYRWKGGNDRRVKKLGNGRGE